MPMYWLATRFVMLDLLCVIIYGLNMDVTGSGGLLWMLIGACGLCCYDMQVFPAIRVTIKMMLTFGVFFYQPKKFWNFWDVENTRTWPMNASVKNSMTLMVSGVMGSSSVTFSSILLLPLPCSSCRLVSPSLLAAPCTSSRVIES